MPVERLARKLNSMPPTWGANSRSAQVVEIVPLGVPGRLRLVEHFAGDSPRLVLADAPEKERPGLIRLAEAEREVRAARRPGVVEHLAACFVGHLYQRLVGQGQDEHLAILVGEGQALAVGRPGRGVPHGLAAPGELFGLAGALLVDQVEFLLAGRVREISDLAAVGRPAGRLVMGPR